MPRIWLLSLFWGVPVWVDSSDPKDWIWPGVRCCPVSKIGHCPVGMLPNCQTRLSFHQPNHPRVGESKNPEWVPTKNVLKENLVCWLIHFFRSLKVTIREFFCKIFQWAGHVSLATLSLGLKPLVGQFLCKGSGWFGVAKGASMEMKLGGLDGVRIVFGNSTLPGIVGKEWLFKQKACSNIWFCRGFLICLGILDDLRPGKVILPAHHHPNPPVCVGEREGRKILMKTCPLSFHKLLRVTCSQMVVYDMSVTRWWGHVVWYLRQSEFIWSHLSPHRGKWC